MSLQYLCKNSLKFVCNLPAISLQYVPREGLSEICMHYLYHRSAISLQELSEKVCNSSIYLSRHDLNYYVTSLPYLCNIPAITVWKLSATSLKYFCNISTISLQCLAKTAWNISVISLHQLCNFSVYICNNCLKYLCTSSAIAPHIWKIRLKYLCTSSAISLHCLCKNLFEICMQYHRNISAKPDCQ